MIAFVRGVISASTRSRSRFQVSRSESTGTATAPLWYAASAVAMFVHALTSTSSPGPMPSARDRQVERGRPARDGDAVACADEVGELALERRAARSPNEPEISPRAKRVDDGLDLFLADVGLEDGDQRP